MSPAQLPGALGLLSPHELPNRIEDNFVQRLRTLPEDAQMLLLVAAAEPADDSPMMWRVARLLGIDATAAAATEAAGLLAIDEHVRFRHPLVRSAVYRSASPTDRRRAHLALAESVDAERDADRRAWHLAAATAGHDEDVARELEASAGRARARGGLAAAAAFLRRSVALTEDTDHRVERALSAAGASLNSGEFDSALDVLTTTERGPLRPGQQARLDLLRGQVVLASGAASRASGLLLTAAQRLERADSDLAFEAYLDAWGGALFASHLTDTTMRDVSRAVQGVPALLDKSDAFGLLLAGMSSLVVDGRPAAGPTLRRAVDTFLEERPAPDRGMRWNVIMSCASVEIWDFDAWDAMTVRQMELARESGALGSLAISLSGLGLVRAWSGDLEDAGRVDAESELVRQATGTQIAPFGGMLLAAVRGRAEESAALLEDAGARAAAEGDGLALQFKHWATAMLCNGLGRYEEALEPAERCWDAWPDLFVSVWAMVEQVEAAVRLDRPELAATALRRIAASTEVGGTAWALGIAARCAALCDDGPGAEALYQRAVEHLAATPLRPELGRARLLYGEWLRRQGRRTDARAQLQLALTVFTAVGAEGFAERARHELVAAGAKATKHAAGPSESLTSQEAHIAELAAAGRTNVQIGAELYLSRHTVEWHLRKVFHKLGVTSRMQLRDALGGADPRRRGMSVLP